MLHLAVGDRAFCLLRDQDVVITSWTDAPISWPPCRALHHRGGSGLLLDDELARADKNESALAIGYWWGVTDGVVWRWRKTLGVGRMDSEGSRRLIETAAFAGGEASRRRGVTEEERIGAR
jgi:hypothetical protein